MRILFPSCLHTRDPRPPAAFDYDYVMQRPAQPSFIMVMAPSNYIDSIQYNGTTGAGSQA
jgi:hypothetical protein